MIAADLPPVDACPALDCHPGLSGPCLPLSWAVLPSGGMVAGYWHEVCGMTWATWFDEHWWVVDRRTAPAMREAAA